MKASRLLLLGLLVAALPGCAEEPSITPSAPASGSGATASDEAREGALVIQPTLELIGMSDVYDRLVVTSLQFDAEVFLIPTNSDTFASGDAVHVRYDFNEGYASTLRPEGDLQLLGPGTFRVLVRVRPEAEAPSVEVEGGYRSASLGKTDDPTPSPAEPTPSPADPTPSPADPTPSPADPTPSPADPTPSPADPTPSPADPTPSPADEPGDAESRDDAPAMTPPNADPTPSPAEPAGTRSKTERTAQSETIYVTSERAFEFYAGEVEIGPDAHTLFVSWDVRTWLRALLAQPLGLATTESSMPEQVEPSGSAFVDTRGDFRIIAR